MLRFKMYEWVTLISFADNLTILVMEKTEESFMNNANTRLQRTMKWMERKRLQLASQKTEAVPLVNICRTHYSNHQKICEELYRTLVCQERGVLGRRPIFNIVWGTSLAACNIK